MRLRQGALLTHTRRHLGWLQDMPRHKPLSLLPLVALIFYDVSGGPFGIEVRLTLTLNPKEPSAPAGEAALPCSAGLAAGKATRVRRQGRRHRPVLPALLPARRRGVRRQGRRCRSVQPASLLARRGDASTGSHRLLGVDLLLLAATHCMPACGALKRAAAGVEGWQRACQAGLVRCCNAGWLGLQCLQHTQSTVAFPCGTAGCCERRWAAAGGPGLCAAAVHLVGARGVGHGGCAAAAAAVQLVFSRGSGVL